MKSRTLYCDGTIFRKAMTRFAPVWVLYTVCLLLGMLLLRQDTSPYWFHNSLSNLLPVMGPINLCYALLAAQLLFGDLYNTRMCNAIHALPVTRDCLFLSHTLAGMTWSILPSIPAALFAMALGIGSPMVDGWQLPLYWLLGTNLQYLFFFGLAAFCALCVGNRFAQALIYGIINFASVITYWLVDTLYAPLLYGIQTKEDPFLLSAPMVQFVNAEYIDTYRNPYIDETTPALFHLNEGWGYLAICAVLGVVLLIAACALYRRRKLECAGDFMAVKALEPVFLVVYSMVVAAAFYFVCDEIIYVGGVAVLYMVVGLVIGFFTGEMLLQRSIKVFRKKTFLKFAILAAAFGATLGITALDPIGITRWMPDGEEVAYVEVAPSHAPAYYDLYHVATLREAEDIEGVLRVHEIALTERYDSPAITQNETVSSNVTTVAIHYHLKNGSVKSRYYYVDVLGEAGDILIPYFNRVEAIFPYQEEAQTFEDILNATQTISVNGYGYEGDGEKDGRVDVDGYTVTIFDKTMIRELMEAIEKDAALNTMSQSWDFRADPDIHSTYWLYFDLGSDSESVTIYTDAVNTNAWLMEHGFIGEQMLVEEAVEGPAVTYVTG